MPSAATLDRAALDRLAGELPIKDAPGRVQVKALAGGAELLLSGVVGDEITLRAAADALASIPAGTPLTIRINSPGGDVFTGLAVYAALVRWTGRKVVVVEGIAASAGSLIAMCGDEIVMPANSFLMVHRAAAFALGDADELRRNAGLLDQVDEQMTAIYAARSGKAAGAVRALMDAETWFTAEEAVAAGFADRIEAAVGVTASFDLSRFKHPPAAAPRAGLDAIRHNLETTMSTTNTVAPPAATIPELRGLARHGRLDDGWVLAQLEAGATMDQARDAALDAAAARSPQPFANIIPSSAAMGGPRAEFEAMGDALVARMQGRAPQGHATVFAHSSLTDMARELLGEQARRWPATRVVAQAMQTTSDFPRLILYSVSSVLLEAFQKAQSPLAARLARVILSSGPGRDVSAARAPEFPVLDPILEHEEIKRGALPWEGEAFAIAQYAKIIALTEEVIRRDDLGAFANLVNTVANAAAETEARELVKLLLMNAGAGPVLSDSRHVFDADHGNQAAVALSNAALGDARRAMRKARDANGMTLSGVTPKFLLVGPDLETQAEQLLAQLAAAQAANVNPFSGKLELLVEPRIDGDDWWVFADPMEAPVLGLGYFTDQPRPRVDQKSGWDVLGLEIRAVHDFGCGFLGWRGAYHSAGAA